MTSWNKTVLFHPSFCVGICVSLLIFPIQWVAAWFVACLIHEMGHYIALKLFCVPVLRITVGFYGARMETGYMRPIAELVSALAGPMAGLSCMFIYWHFPLLAVCGLIQSVYNLLPFPDYDGGRVLRMVINCVVTPCYADRIYRWILWLFALSIIVAGFYMWLIADMGVIFMAISMILVSKSGIIKIPCKGRKQIVQ